MNLLATLMQRPAARGQELFEALDEVMPAPIAFILVSAFIFGVYYMFSRWPKMFFTLTFGSLAVAVLIAKTT